MAIRPVLKYPAAVLRRCADPVVVFDHALAAFAEELLDSLYAHKGAIGLAAPQIGESVRVIVVDMTANTTRDTPRILVNPTIVSQSRQKTVREGCLSFPEYLANVRRSLRVHFSARDIYGNPIEDHVEGLEAVCIQHEIDHLDGVLMIDRVNSLNSDWIRRTNS